MPELLLKAVKIWDPRSAFHGAVLDVQIRRGKIQKIDRNLNSQTSDAVVIAEDDLWVSPAWCDVGAHIPDPGHEYNEDFDTARTAALNGGYADVLVWPDTEPVVDHKGAVMYINSRNAGSVVHFHAIGAISAGLKGEHPAEMYDMFYAGAKAFSDGLDQNLSPALLARALEYLLPLGCYLIHRPTDRLWKQDRPVHEGLMSVKMGLKGQPGLAEWMSVQNGLAVSGYTGGKLFIADLSAQQSVILIQEARKNKINIACSINPMNLLFDDASLEGFSAAYKTDPVLRGKADREALLQAYIEGHIDVLGSNHMPRCAEHKDREFGLAVAGVSSLDTVFASVRTMADVPLDRLLDSLSIRPRTLFNLEPALIGEGESSWITLFGPDRPWLCSPDTMRSKSKNSPLIGRTLKGLVYGVIRGNEWWINSHSSEK